MLIVHAIVVLLLSCASDASDEAVAVVVVAEKKEVDTLRSQGSHVPVFRHFCGILCLIDESTRQSRQFSRLLAA